MKVPVSRKKVILHCSSKLLSSLGWFFTLWVVQVEEKPGGEPVPDSSQDLSVCKQENQPDIPVSRKYSYYYDRSINLK
jgi:hypothetical protein